jgi:DNA-binding transcriptional LysR family regulator
VVRIAGSVPSTWIARPVGSFRVITAASPRYLRARGRPKTPAQLRGHDCLSFLHGDGPLRWPFRGMAPLPVQGRLHAASGFALTRAAVAGLGIVHLFEPFLREPLASGALVPVLEDFEPDPFPIVVAYPDRRLPSRTRAFIEFLRTLLRTEDKRK